jgi:hypothetical protein
MKRMFMGLALAAGLFMAGSQAQAQQYTIVKSVIGNGGAPMGNTQYGLNGTIGQSVIGVVGNSSYAMGQGFWFGLLDTSTTSVPVAGYAAEGNVLQQNFPNPAKGETFIKFTLARRGEIVMKVFSMPGQEVATLATGVYEAGEHEVRFVDPKLPSGTYFYQLQVGNHTLRRQMLLVQ